MTTPAMRAALDRAKEALAALLPQWHASIMEAFDKAKAAGLSDLEALEVVDECAAALNEEIQKVFDVMGTRVELN